MDIRKLVSKIMKEHGEWVKYLSVLSLDQKHRERAGSRTHTMTKEKTLEPHKTFSMEFSLLDSEAANKREHNWWPEVARNLDVET